MTKSSTGMEERHIRVNYDKNGEPYWRSTMSSPDNSIAVLRMVPDRIIPVIFVPGVMGSNLKSTKNPDVTWRLDEPDTMAPWIMRKADTRKKFLTPSGMVVDDGGKIGTGTHQGPQELRRRGWGEVGFMSYGEFLVWLENALNDYDDPQSGERERLIGAVLGATKGEAPLTREEVALSYRYRFPVHAFGYNWLDSNIASAQELAKRIEAVINRYKKARKKCEKVILVTHSMGGLVARYCSEVLGMRDKILGIVHGVMPAIGAAAVYRRMKAGTENPKGNIEGWLASKVLGASAAEMTAVLSSAPGPLQLLPTPEYGNGWLQIKTDGADHQLPQNGDPYNEIYTVRGKWWSLCDDQLMNPLNKELNYQSRLRRMDSDWSEFSDIIRNEVKVMHRKVANRYHGTTYAFHGSDNSFRAYGNVTWTGRSSLGEELWRGGRPIYALDGRALNVRELGTARTVATPLGGEGWKQGVHQTYRLSEPDEPGDGTVPDRSGRSPEAHVHSLLQVTTEHEAAYRDCEPARQFTLRAIVQIAQAVKATALRYE